MKAYFASRPENQHEIDGILQLIENAATHMGWAAKLKGKEGAQHQEGGDPVKYLADEIDENNQDARRTLKRKAEFNLGYEMLADELGIKDGVLKALASLQDRLSR